MFRAKVLCLEVSSMFKYKSVIINSEYSNKPIRWIKKEYTQNMKIVSACEILTSRIAMSRHIVFMDVRCEHVVLYS
jgi:hypothetical protein